MRIAVTGASGLLGIELVPRLVAAGHTVIAGTHQSATTTQSEQSQTTPRQLQLELTSDASIRQFLNQAEAECIIHTAALTDVDRCEREPELATEINGTATEHLVVAAKRTATRIIYISTDYVFNGHDGPYDENDQTDPINVYGQTKLAGEAAVLSASESHAVVRTASLINGTDQIRRCFLDYMGEQLRHNPPLLAADDQFANITPVGYLAAAIVTIAEQSHSGLWHLAGAEIVSRYDLACRLARLYSLPISTVTRVSSSDFKRDAKRPLNGGLLTGKAKTQLFLAIPTLEQALTAWHSRTDAF